MKPFARLLVLPFLAFGWTAAFAGSPPLPGDMLPEIVLEVPSDAAHRKYLGVEGKSTFQIPDVKARVVIIEIFSMYCPHCQREAPTLNRMFQKIEADPNLQGRVKMIGIGVGNSAFEIEFFRKTYQIRFPLFPDKNFDSHRKLGEVRTPYFIGIHIDADGAHRVFYSKLGGAKKAETLLNRLLQDSGLL